MEHLGSMLRSGTVSQALLFSGLPGIGKRKVALRLIKSLFCREENCPCLECRDCRLIQGGSHPDVIEISPNEKGTIPIGDSDEPGTVRWLISRLSKRSMSGRYGVIINGMENITVMGQNALLKTVEEPPEGAVIIMITANKQLVLPTIQSRATEISFRELTKRQLLEVLEKQDISSPQIDLIADISGGSVELAAILAQGDILGEVEKTVSSIADYLLDGSPPDFTLDGLQKKIGLDNAVFLLMNSFRVILMDRIRSGEREHLFSKYTSIDTETLARVIKIFLSLKKSLAVNVNAMVALKGLLYSIDGMTDPGLPGFEPEFLR